jgi:hypothetical protein
MEARLNVGDDEVECSFKPKIIQNYQNNTNCTSDLNFQERSQAWQRRKVEKLNKQREEFERLKEFEDHLPLKSNEQRTNFSGRKKSTVGAPALPNYDMTEEQYAEIRLNSIRKSMEKQISNSHRARK